MYSLRIGPGKTINKLICFTLFALAVNSFGAPLSQEEAVDRAINWMAGNPVMQAADDRTIASIEVFPDTGGYSVYVIQLSPAGYLVLNSDDRLPLVVSFSSESMVDLSDTEQNAFRAMLLRHVARMEEQLNQPFTMQAATVAEMGIMAVTELHGPFLETTWNQCNPYNLLCPDDPGGTEYYGYRVPVGCTPTAYAQVLQYHRWPLYGQGSYSYADNWGSTTGQHSADYSDPYDWSSMLSSYDAFSPNPPAAEDAVAELMYELGVAAEANYESSGTSSSIGTLGNRLGEFYYFESCERHYDLTSLTGPLEADLRAGFPCVVAIPGHAIVADGLMVDSGATTYHINYGWGGSNNGWWSADNVAGDALEDGVASLRPRLLAFPGTNAVAGVAGETVELQWILPKRRELEVEELSILRLEQQVGTWQTDASEITGINDGWEVVSGGRSGDCWYTGPNGPSSMVLDQIFFPDASASLTFWFSRRLGTATFSVEVSADNGDSYTTLFSDNDNYNLSWEQESVSLAAYAGQQIRLRFALSSGSYYASGGGVSLDDLAITSGDWYAWQSFVTDDTLASRRFSSITSDWDDCDDFSIFEETSTSTYKEWVCSTTSGVGNCFYKQPGGYGNHAYHLTSYSTITPTASTRLLLRAKYSLASDGFRILVSDNGSTFTEIWSAAGTADWSDISADLSTYAGQPIYIRLEYTTGSYYGDGGIWIDSISIQEVTNPELEGQPVYYTVLTNLPAGTHTLAAALTDTNAAEHGLAPSFTLTVSGLPDDGDGMPRDWEELYGLDPNINDADLDPDEDGCSNLKEYICGTVPTNEASCWLLESGDGSLPAFYAATDRVYTIQYRTNLTSGSWLPLVIDIPGSNLVVDVADYDSATNAARYYRVEVRHAD